MDGGESDKIRPQIVNQLSTLGYKIIEIKDFVLQQLETVKIIIDVSVRRSAPGFGRVRVADDVQARPQEASHGKDDEEASASEKLAAVEAGRGKARAGGVAQERAAAGDIRVAAWLLGFTATVVAEAVGWPGRLD